MASGICQAAILSGTRYVVFKNPQHDPDEMSRELGDLDSLPFAANGQFLWRCEDTIANLQRALLDIERE